MQRSSFFFLFVLTGSVSAMSGCAEVEVPKGPVEIPSRIYTANESSNDVSVIDAGTFAAEHDGQFLRKNAII